MFTLDYLVPPIALRIIQSAPRWTLSPPMMSPMRNEEYSAMKPATLAETSDKLAHTLLIRKETPGI